MYYALGSALCLAVIFLVMAATAMLCAAGLRFLDLRRFSPSAVAGILFAIRALPVTLAAVVAFGFALPAFFRFEPRSSGEFIGMRLLSLAAMGAAVLGAMTARALRILRATARLRRQWLAQAVSLTVEGLDLPVYSVNTPGPLMAVIGIFHPEIFVARRFAGALTPEELSAALAHEMAHVRSLDNLKRLFLKISRAPQWLISFHLSDTAWTNASEVAADEAALASGASAIDLSSALVKAGRLGANPALCEAAVSHLLPDVTRSSFELRVAHLREVLEENSGVTSGARTGGRYHTALFFFSLLAVYVISFNAVLPWFHEVLEILAR